MNSFFMKEIVNSEIALKDKIYKIRNKQVMLDRDLAELYGVETRRLNEQVKRNKDRFPKDFCFQLNKAEYLEILKSQIAISSLDWGGVRKLPYAFTEQGVSMLSAVLKSKTAIAVSIKIIKAFVQMRHFLIKNESVFVRLDSVERKQIEYEIKSDDKFNKIFNVIESKQLTPKQGIFYDGELFDAFSFVNGLVKKAKNKIILIDNYVSEETLIILTNKQKSVKVTIYTKHISSQLELAKDKFNQQYYNLEFIIFNKSHDRFLIIDDEVYLIGASLKDLGKKWFGFFKIEDPTIIKKIHSELSDSEKYKIKQSKL